MKILKILGVVICVALLILVVNTLWNSNITDYSATCLELKPDDSETFGRGLAVNKNYLAVGDPKANRVAIYRRQEDGNWLRIKEILPPKNSNAVKIGHGFGANLALNDETLIIDSVNDNWNRGLAYYNGNNTEELFAISINQDEALQKIDYPSVNSMPISALSFLGQDIAFATRTETAPNQWINRIYLADTKSGKIARIIESSELQYQRTEVDNYFEIHLDSYKNFLVAAYHLTAWNPLVYMISPEGKVKEISINRQEFEDQKQSPCGLRSFSISQDLMATSCIANSNSVVFQNFPQISLVGSSYVLGIVEAKYPYVLISHRSNSPWNPFNYDGYQQELMTVEDGKIVNRSYIRWLYSRKTHLTIVQSMGVISDQDLFLSAEDGRVVRLPIENMPSSYQINPNICGE